ncbi:MAG: hypothetical protein HKM93_01160 [Desulfobacteraceae bacterium]|nr:hypothetical protein [Desulfobacteraceae bacterium]
MKLTDILQAIEDEPELPGDMPPDMAASITEAVKTGNTDFLLYLMRLAVVMTKRGIKERVETRYHSENPNRRPS